MRAETSLQTTQGKWIQTTGTITWVGDATSSEVLRGRMTSTATKEAARDVGGTPSCDFLLNVMGSVNEQLMKSVSRISQHGDSPVPFDQQFVAEITYRFDVTMHFPWVVEDIRPIRGSELDRFTCFTYEFFEGCQCDRCLQQKSTMGEG